MCGTSVEHKRIRRLVGEFVQRRTHAVDHHLKHEVDVLVRDVCERNQQRQSFCSSLDLIREFMEDNDRQGEIFMSDTSCHRRER